jgi:F-type H+-transporting ATPase subunit delta
LQDVWGCDNQSIKLKYLIKTSRSKITVSHKSDNQYVIGQRYAKAFCHAGVSDQEINQFLEVGTLLSRDSLFLPALNASRGKSPEGNLEWVRSFSKKLDLLPKVSNFLALIALKNRLNSLGVIVSTIQDSVNAKQGRDFATVISAKPLSDAEIEAVKTEIKTLLNFEPILEIKTDPKLLGGYVVRTRSVLIDNSLKSRIEKLHNTMKGVA